MEEQQPDEPFRRRSRWREHVRAKAVGIEYERDRLEAQTAANLGDGVDVVAVKASVRRATDRHLETARAAAGPRRRVLGPIWRTVAGGEGAAIDAGFVNLHAAEVELVDLYGWVDIQAAVPGVLARMRNCVPSTDERLRRAEDALELPITTSPRRQHWLRRRRRAECPTDMVQMKRAALREAMEVSYDAADELYSHARGFRNALIISTAVLTVLVVAVCVFGALRPTAIPLCFEPSAEPGDQASAVCPSSTGANQPSSWDVMIVALMGLLGGALSVTFTIQRLRGNSTPYDIPLALTLNKLPAGALTGVVGLLLVHGKFIPGLSELDTQGQILAWALLLGFAQHLVTRYVDEKARSVINSIPSKSSQTTRPDAENAPIASWIPQWRLKP